MANLTAKAFELLFKRLDEDASKSADKYFVLRRRIIFCLSKKGCSEVKLEDLADEVFDRIAVKLESGEEIENFDFYARRVLHFVWLEYLRKNKEDNYGDDTPDIPVPPDMPEETDLRIACLRTCLIDVAPDESDRKLILGYYDNEEEKNKDKRKSLAQIFGLKMNTLKQKARRLRIKLEICINECVKKHESAVTK